MKVPRIALVALSALALASVVALTGCDRGGGDTTIADPGGLFHFTVPGEWPYQSTPGFITAYSGKEMPDADTAIGKELWLQVYTSQEASKTPVAKEIVALVKARAKNRGWTDAEIGKPVKTKVGNRPAYQVDVSATDDKKRDFEGRVVLARVDDNEVLIFGFTEPGAFEKSAFDEVLKNFYWSGAKPLPEKKETTKAPAPKKK